MRKKRIIITCVAVCFILVFVASANNNPTKNTNMPKDVKTAIEKSCFGCHNTASRNTDAKEELDFKKLDDLSLIKKISAYKKIGETIEEGEMPPKKFIQKYPNKQLSDKEKELLIDWAKKEAVALVKSK